MRLLNAANSIQIGGHDCEVLQNSMQIWRFWGEGELQQPLGVPGLPNRGPGTYPLVIEDSHGKMPIFTLGKIIHGHIESNRRARGWP